MKGKLFRGNSTKTFFFAGSAVVILAYISTLRVSDGLLYRRPILSENPVLGALLAIVSTILLVSGLSNLEGEIEEVAQNKDREMIIDLTVLLLLMFPGTGLGMEILTRFGVPDVFPFIMSGIAYCFIPVFYTLNIKNRNISELGFIARDKIKDDVKTALILSFLSVMIIEPFNIILPRIAKLQPQSGETGLPLIVLPLIFAFHGLGMIQNIAWNGLIQNKIERRFNWNQKGLILSFLFLAFLLQTYFEPKESFRAVLAYAPGNTLGLFIMCLLFHKTKRIYPPALWHWFTNFIGMIPYT